MAADLSASKLADLAAAFKDAALEAICKEGLLVQVRTRTPLSERQEIARLSRTLMASALDSSPSNRKDMDKVAVMKLRLLDLTLTSFARVKPDSELSALIGEESRTEEISRAYSRHKAPKLAALFGPK